jgi:hypothetical protein
LKGEGGGVPGWRGGAEREKREGVAPHLSLPGGWVGGWRSPGVGGGESEEGGKGEWGWRGRQGARTLR